MDLSSIIYQLHSGKVPAAHAITSRERAEEANKPTKPWSNGQNAEDIETFSVGPSMVHPSILYPRLLGIQCALGPDISGLFPTQASKH